MKIIRIQYCILISVVYTALFTGCTLPLEVKYKKFSSKDYPARTEPARVFDGKVRDLINGEYELLGYIDTKRNVRKCYTDGTCDTVTEKLPEVKDVLAEAAINGADYVTLLEDKKVFEPISKTYCSATSTYSYTVEGRTVFNTVCISHATIHGQLEAYISRALVWRSTPGQANVKSNTLAVSKALKTLAQAYKVDTQTDPLSSPDDKARPIPGPVGYTSAKQARTIPAPVGYTSTEKASEPKNDSPIVSVKNRIKEHIQSEPQTYKTKQIETASDFIFEILDTVNKNYIDAIDIGELFAAVLNGMNQYGNGVNTEKVSSEDFSIDSPDFSENIALTYVQTFKKIQKKNPKLSIDDLLKNVADSVISNTDEKSRFLSKKDIEVFQTGSAAIGVTIHNNNNQTIIVDLASNGPAERAGLKPGDVLLSIDGIELNGMSLQEVVGKLKGNKNSAAIINISRAGEMLSFSIERDEIKQQPIVKIIDKGLIYIKLASLRTNTAEKMEDEAEQLLESYNESLQGIILDLRSNHGGILSSAVEVADVFVTRGRILTTKGRSFDEDLHFHAVPSRGPLEDSDVKMAVLVDAETAAGAELVAGVLRYHRDAVLIGYNTIGAGTVQSIRPLRRNTALRLTTARMHFPNDDPLTKSGLSPDYCSHYSKDNKQFSIVKVGKGSSCERSISYKPEHRQQELEFALNLLKNTSAP